MTNIFELNKKITEPKEKSSLRTAFSDPGLTQYFKSNKISTSTLSAARRVKHKTQIVDHDIMLSAARRII
jgi:hypothetical protein